MYSGNGTRRATTYVEADREKWQGRKDSNLGPSVLETDALTRLSYAPSPARILPDAQSPISEPD